MLRPARTQSKENRVAQSFLAPVRAILENRREGLYCIPGDFYVDPVRRVPRAIITHAHADHACTGHETVLATPQTIAIMQARSGRNCAGRFEPLDYGKPLRINDVTVTLRPAGHVFGSAQVVMEYKGYRVVAPGDFKRSPDPTCAPFEPVSCHCFITEATFALPLFQLPPVEDELAKLMQSIRLFPECTHVLLAYSLGKAQQLIALLRGQGLVDPILVHPSVWDVCQVYEAFGVAMGVLEKLPQNPLREKNMPGIAVMPPGRGSTGLAELFGNHRTVGASGWLHTSKGRKRRTCDLPLVISDHADWPELLRTIEETHAETVLVTHGPDAALKRALHGGPVNCAGLTEL